jgi:hypothetical protein
MTGSRNAYDHFERHYAEKLWSLVPEIHRFVDGTAERPGQLRALIELLAGEAAIERRSIDRIQADSRILEADDWAVPYIAQLLGTRLVSPLNPLGRRADVANTIEYRRRAGTVRLLERLARDIAGWDAVVSEAFRRLIRFPHGLDRDFPPGPVTATPPGGYPDLRRARIADVIGGPFEDLAYRPEFRPGRGVRGRYNIPIANLFLYRKQAIPLTGVTPYVFDAKHYALDPSGRANLQLFQRGWVDLPDCHRPDEWDVRMPISCLRLNAERYVLPIAQAGGGPGWTALAGRTFETLSGFLAAAAAAGAGNLPALLLAALDPDCPKARLLAWSGDAEASIALGPKAGQLWPPDVIAAANLAGWADSIKVDPHIGVLVDPVTGLVELTTAPAAGQGLDIDLIYYGMLLPIGAGGQDRSATMPEGAPTVLAGPNPDLSTPSGDLLIADSRTLQPVTNTDTVKLQADTRLWSANRMRPYVVFKPQAANAITIDAGAGRPNLVIDGLWLGSQLTGAGDLAELRLKGRFASVTLRDVSLDPGGVRAALSGGAASAIPHLRLILDGEVEALVIDRCITGSIHEAAGAGSGMACSVATVSITDSIMLARSGNPLLVIESADATIARSTLIGDCHLGRAEITDTIIDGALVVQDAQDSCLRFSMVRSGGLIPSPYQCVILPDGMPAGGFESTRFGDAGLCVLTPACPETIAKGGEDGKEMGAYNRALVPILTADLEAKIAEFSPVRAIVQLQFAT